MKQAIIIRRDLKLGPGKAAAQACHAAIESFLKTRAGDRDAWLSEGEKKVVLRAENEEELRTLLRKCGERKVPAALIRDAGLTQIPSGTVTALGIGPAEDSVIDSLVGGMKLY